MNNGENNTARFQFYCDVTKSKHVFEGSMFEPGAIFNWYTCLECGKDVAFDKFEAPDLICIHSFCQGYEEEEIETDYIWLLCSKCGEWYIFEKSEITQINGEIFIR